MKPMKKRNVVLALLILSSVAFAEGMREDFANPPLAWKSRPLWFWNGPADEETTRTVMEKSKSLGYAGFGILPAHDKDAFMSPDFLDDYVFAVETAAALGLKLCLYDEFWFPSGSAGNLMAKNYPEALNKCLEKVEVEITGPTTFEDMVSDGRLMGVVAMNMETLARIDITGQVKEGRIHWSVPEGAWKIMQFLCKDVGEAGLVDYLDPEAVRKFVSLTYEGYYQRFPEHFGTTIDMAFFDEPTLYRTPNGRTWTPAFNEKFEQRHGYNPVVYYPAMWYDIGAETAAARNALFGFRAELYAEGFMKVLNEWCAGHKIRLTGHQDQEEIVNQTGIAGDLIKSFKYQDIPGIDQIFKYNRAAKAYKVISSAAYNYDRPHVMTECYGGTTDMPVENLYKEAMDQFAKGINMMVPHAVWYDAHPDKVVFQPELSHRTEPWASELPAYNEYIGRLHRVLQHGRHIADIAVLYPIATLHAGYWYDVGDRYLGEPTPPEADYMDIGERLATGIQRDFTFLHPEVLDETCTVEGDVLRLNNANNFEAYHVFIMPGATTIHLTNLQKIKQFYDAGGKVIATTCLPYKSAAFGKDAEVQAIIKEMFGVDPLNQEQTGTAASPVKKTNANGGRTCFLKNPTEDALRSSLDEAIPVCDVNIETGKKARGGNLAYIHKVIENRDVYFIANSSRTDYDLAITLRGKHVLEIWNPHTGAIEPISVTCEEKMGTAITCVQMPLGAVQSRFLVTK